MSEKSESKKMGGKLQKNSGRGLYQKGDIKLDPFVIDLKEYAESFAVSRKVWAKTCSDASRSNGEPALMLALGSGQETVRLWVISDTMFHEMHQAWTEKYEK